MKTIAVNLKLLYQNREMAIWYFILGIIILLTFAVLPNYSDGPPTSINQGYFNSIILIKPFLSLIIFGFAMGRMVADIWNKPVLLCLPGQVKTSLTILTLTGLVFVTATTVLMMTIIPWMELRSPEVIIALFTFYLMTYWLSVFIILRFNESVLIILFLYFTFLIMPLMGRTELLIFIQRLLLIHPWGWALVCLIIICMIYYAVSSRALAKSLSGAPWVMFFTGMNAPESKKHRLSNLINTPYTEGIEDFNDRLFSGLIRSNNQSVMLSNFWGRLYEISSYLISNHLIISFITVSIFFCCLHMGNHIIGINLQPFYFGLFGILGGHIFVISRSNILLPVSWRMQLSRGLTELIVSMSLMLLAISGFVFISKALLRTPDFTSYLFSLKYEYIPLQDRYVMFSAIALPLTSGLLTIFRKRDVLSLLSIIVLIISLLAINLFVINNEINIFEPSNLVLSLLIALLSLGFYFSSLYYECAKRTLY